LALNSCQFFLKKIQAKREVAKKEGRLLTKKQKEEKQMAELRKQALLASGVQIEGLHHGPGSGPPAAKKVVYGNRKKKGTTATKDGSVASESRPRSPDQTSEVPSPHHLPQQNCQPKKKSKTTTTQSLIGKPQLMTKYSSLRFRQV
jgi:hypothetical protein